MYLYNASKMKILRRALRKNSTVAEQKLWKILRNRQMLGIRFFRQYGVGRYILDFYCPFYRLAIEVDGWQHNDRQIKIYDIERSAYLKKKNIKELRFWNYEVLRNIEGVWKKIYECMQGE